MLAPLRSCGLGGPLLDRSGLERNLMNRDYLEYTPVFRDGLTCNPMDRHGLKHHVMDLRSLKCNLVDHNGLKGGVLSRNGLRCRMISRKGSTCNLMGGTMDRSGLQCNSTGIGMYRHSLGCIDRPLPSSRVLGAATGCAPRCATGAATAMSGGAFGAPLAGVRCGALATFGGMRTRPGGNCRPACGGALAPDAMDGRVACTCAVPRGAWASGGGIWRRRCRWCSPWRSCRAWSRRFAVAAIIPAGAATACAMPAGVRRGLRQTIDGRTPRLAPRTAPVPVALVTAGCRIRCA